jgi:hypothetical protein
MWNWQEILKTSPIEWLLEEENPSVRYFTLLDILDKNGNDLDVEAARSAICNSKVVSKIFSRQNAEGYWEDPASPYLPKYKSTYWQIMLLGYLGIDKEDDERVEKACEYIFNFQLVEGGFSMYGKAAALGEYELIRKQAQRRGEKISPKPDRKWLQSFIIEHEYSCLTGNMVAALIRLGYIDDSRVKKALDWLVEIQNKDGGWLCPYWKAHIKDTHGCFYGTICPLEAFSKVPRKKLTKEMAQAIERGAEFLLMHRLFRADHHGFKIIKSDWLKFGFPLFYRYDVLRGLLVMTKLGYNLSNDERLNDAVGILFQKRCPDGKWILENTPSSRMQTNIEVRGKSSKWVTLNALRVLKYLSKDSDQ